MRHVVRTAHLAALCLAGAASSAAQEHAHHGTAGEKQRVPVDGPGAHDHLWTTGSRKRTSPPPRPRGSDRGRPRQRRPRRPVPLENALDRVNDVLTGHPVDRGPQASVHDPAPSAAAHARDPSRQQGEEQPAEQPSDEQDERERHDPPRGRVADQCIELEPADDDVERQPGQPRHGGQRQRELHHPDDAPPHRHPGVERGADDGPVEGVAEVLTGGRRRPLDGLEPRRRQPDAGRTR